MAARFADIFKMIVAPIFLIGAFFFSPATLVALTCTTTADVNWNASICAGCSGNPGVNDTAVIAEAHNVTLNI
jgi:hypothetical protein